MAKKVRIEMNSKGIQELLKSDEVTDFLEGEAKSLASKAGPGYAATAGSEGKTRTRAFVHTTDWASFNDNARNATLLRALGGG